MSLRRISKWLVAGALSAPGMASAAGDCCNPCAPVTTCKVTCVEYVPEQVPVTRTTYRTECREEAYTAHRCEWVQQQEVCTKTTYKPVCETVNETRVVCEAVPVTEQRTCTRTVWKTVPVTITKKVMVDRGHYECCEVRARRTIIDRLTKSNTDCCPRMESKKVWVPCCVCEDRCVTCCQRVCEQVPYTYCVTTCKMVQKTITVPCTRTRCVAEQCQYTVTKCVPKLIDVPCTRTVRVCVPVTETVMCCRMVPKCVEKVVPSCSCGTTTTCCSSGSHGLFHKNRGHGECGGCGCGCN